MEYLALGYQEFLKVLKGGSMLNYSNECIQFEKLSHVFSNFIEKLLYSYKL